LSGATRSNTAIALGRLGVETGFVCGISNDFFGDMLVEELHRSGVSTSLCSHTSLPTTLAFVTLNDGSASYTFYEEGSAGQSFSQSNIPSVPSETLALHFGAVSLISEPCGSTYEEMLFRNSEHLPFHLIPISDHLLSMIPINIVRE